MKKLCVVILGLLLAAWAQEQAGGRAAARQIQFSTAEEAAMYDGRPLGVWLEMLNDRDISVRVDAAFALGQYSVGDNAP